MQFLYVQNVESDEPIMLLNRHIGFDEVDGMGIDGSLFQQELLALDEMGKKRIQVWINSVGGLVIDGYNIANAILKSKTRVDTYCVGMAASIAGVIYQCGRKRVMSDYGILMYHNPYAGDKTSSPLLDTMKESLNTIISNRCKMSSEEVQRMMDRTTYIQADEALQMGLCDEIEQTVKLNTKYMPKASEDAKVYWLEANKVLNKYLLTKNKVVMIKVTNRLQLNAEANEDAILAEIEKISNRATEAEAQAETLTAQLATIEAERDEAKNKFTEKETEYNAIKTQLDALKAEKDAIEDAAKEEKAKNLVTAAVKIGKIKNEVKIINDWTAKAKADFDGTKGLIDSIPTNKASAKFEVKNAEEKPQTGSLIASATAKLSMKLDGKN